MIPMDTLYITAPISTVATMSNIRVSVLSHTLVNRQLKTRLILPFLQGELPG